MKRLTTDNPVTIAEKVLNVAYGKDNRVRLRSATFRGDVDLCEYMSTAGKGFQTYGQGLCGKPPEFIMENCWQLCQCDMNVLYIAAVQAAELRARLKMIEDILGDTYDLNHLRKLVEADREEADR